MIFVCRKYCLEAIGLSEKLIKLSQDAHSDCDDDRCLVLFGIILDSASKIRLEAEIRLKMLETETAKHGIGLRGSGLPWRD
jgi:invasion protein IalB